MLWRKGWGLGHLGSLSFPSAIKEVWRPLLCCNPALCEYGVLGQAVGAKGLSRTAGDLWQSSQESAMTFPTLYPFCFCSLLTHFCPLITFTSPFQAGLCQTVLPRFPSSLWLGCPPSHPQTLGQGAGHGQRDMSSPSFLARFKRQQLQPQGPRLCSQSLSLSPHE